MSVIDQTANGRTEAYSRPADTITTRRRETKLFAKTSEFWVTLIGVIAVAAIYNASEDASLDLVRACLLATVIGVGYIVSRGFAKAGSRDHRNTESTY